MEREAPGSMLMLIASLVVMVGILAQAPESAAAPARVSKEDAPKPLVAFPHPLVTEVLLSVPRGLDGDANQDGTRSATGDEFVELVNPHDKPINLKGYRLIDGTTVGGKGSRPDDAPNDVRNNPKSKPANTPTGKDDADSSPSDAVSDGQTDDAHFAFTFPELTLQPGEVVVVFNGFGSSMIGEIGSSEKPAGKHETFGGAYVFDAKITSQYAAFSNQHDVLQVLSPKGDAVETIRWDYRDEKSGGRTTDAPKRGDTGTAGGGKPDRTRTSGSSRAKPARERDVLDKRAEEAAGGVENLPRVRSGSVQRESIAAEFRPHEEVGGTLFSPGIFVVARGGGK